jgi:pilus assembly protein CpaE
MENILPIGIAALVVLFLLLLLVVVLRRRKAKKLAATASAAAPAAVPNVPAESPSASSLTSLIGQAKVPEAKPAATRQQPTPSESAAPVANKPSVSPLPTRLVKPGSTGNKIRILIVDDNQDTRLHVSRLIAFESDMEVVGQAYNGITGLELAGEYQPHIVLMDINMPDMDGITATREMSMQYPYCQVIIISVQFEQDYMRSAMLAGARDYQTKPFTADELVNCIRRVYKANLYTYQQIDATRRPVSAAASATEIAVIERATSGLNTPLFMMYGPRGGTGTSALAVNFAAALDRIQHGVTLVDADLQFGDLPVHLNLRPTKSLADLTTSNRPDAEVLPELLLTHPSGLNLLCAPPRPEIAELITGSMLVQVARRLRDRSTAVVIDSPSYLTDQNLALFDIVNLVLLVVTPDLPSIKNARIFCDLAPHVGLTLDRIVLVINRATMVGGVPAPQVMKLLGLARVFSIPDDPKLRYSSVKGATIFQLDAAAPAAQAIGSMAQALWDLTTTTPKPTPEAAPPAVTNRS